MSQEYNEYRSLLKKGSFIEASRFAELQHLKSDINNPFWPTRQAAALTRAKKFNQALEIAKQALSLDPSNPYSVLAVAEASAGFSSPVASRAVVLVVEAEVMIAPFNVISRARTRNIPKSLCAFILRLLSIDLVGALLSNGTYFYHEWHEYANSTNI